MSGEHENLVLERELARLRQRVQDLEEENIDLKRDLGHMEAQHETLESFVLGLKQEHERARIAAEGARSGLSAAKAEQDDLLEHMQQGILTLGSDLRINAGYSRAACHLFGQSSLTGLTLTMLLGEQAPHDLPRYLRLLFDSTAASPRLMERLNPLRSHRYFDATGRERVVAFSFSRITSRAGVVQKVIVVMDDCSELERLNQVLAQKNREQWERLDRAYRILSLPADAFRDFVREAGEAQRLLEAALEEPERVDWSSALRALHSVKGNARALGLDDLAELAHTLEDATERLSQKRGEARLALARDRLSAFARALDDGHQLFSHLTELRQSLSSHEQSPLDDLLRSLEKLAEREAESVHKQVRFVCDKVGLIVLDGPTLYRLRSALVQLVRNAVHHGIEPPGERTQRGKPERGELRVELRVHAQQLMVSCTDDGRGIDSQKVREHAIEQGLVSEAEAARLGRDAVLKLVLKPGFSTELQPHLGAGRGIGLSVVSDALDSLRGTIEIHSEHGVGTEFRLVMPAGRALSEQKVEQGGYDEHPGGR
jgi:signal transduction histidine kinase